MIEMQKLSRTLAGQPDIKLKWVTLEEGVLRQRVTTDIATKGGQFDVMTIGMYEAPIWGEEGLAAGAEDRRRLRRGRPAARRAQRPVRRRQAVRRTVLRRKLHAHVPQGPEPTRRACRCPSAHLAADQGPGRQDPRPKNGVYGICLRGKPG